MMNTLLMGNVAPNAINVSLFKKLPFDPVKDFAPVSLVAVTPNIRWSIRRLSCSPPCRRRCRT